MNKFNFKSLSKLNKAEAMKAQAMVEFIIILPVMLTLILAIIQFALIYKAKITLNYATYETARAGTINNASLEDMHLAFSSSMAPLYTTSYQSIDSSGDCSSSFDTSDAAREARVGTEKITGDGFRSVLDDRMGNFNSDSVICARRTVQQQIEDGYVRISVVNPSFDSFSSFGVTAYHDVTGDGDIKEVNLIPNDNLMYRDSTVVGVASASQSIQDANLLKVHVGYCYELIIPFINRMVWAMQQYGPGSAPPAETAYGNYWADPTATPPGFFGPPAGDFATSCITNPTDTGRRSIVLYSQSIMRMQSPAVECKLTDPNTC
jgi:Flp pilus assembly protein TadG